MRAGPLLATVCCKRSRVGARDDDSNYFGYEMMPNKIKKASFKKRRGKGKNRERK